VVSPENVVGRNSVESLPITNLLDGDRGVLDGGDSVLREVVEVVAAGGFHSTDCAEPLLFGELGDLGDLERILAREEDVEDDLPLLALEGHRLAGFRELVATFLDGRLLDLRLFGDGCCCCGGGGGLCGFVGFHFSLLLDWIVNHYQSKNIIQCLIHVVNRKMGS